jgi:glycosyltransferase involved in cell wall biosynthesis
VGRLRIGVFFNDSSIPAAGGAFTQREAIVESLMQSKTEHEFVYFFYGKMPTDTKLENCVPLKGKKIAWVLKQLYHFTGFSLFKKMIPLNRALEKNKIDLLYFVEPNFQPVVVPYIASVWDIAHLHVPFFPEMHTNEEWEKREVMYQRYLRKASFVIASTYGSKDLISESYTVPAEKIKVIRSPIPQAFFNSKGKGADMHKKYNLPENYFLYPAQLWAHKNHYAIIQALKRINDVYKKKVHVAFVGSNKGNKDYLQAQAKELGVNEQVHFLGFVPTQDLIDLYKQSIGALYMTFVNAEGLPVAEAFVLGTPVISSNITALKDQVGDAGLILDPLDSNELADAMVSILTNEKLRKTLVKKGSIKAKELTKEEFGKKILAVFDEYANLRKRWAK